MDFIYLFIKLFSTFIEGLIVLFVPGLMCERKYTKEKNMSLVVLFAFIYTALITLSDYFDSAVFAGTIIAMAYSLIVNFIMSKAELTLRISALTVTWFFLHASDYVATYGVIMFLSGVFKIPSATALILGTGTPRAVFLVVHKLIQVLLFYLFRKSYPKMKMIGKKNLILFSAIAAVAYILINIMTGLIFSGSLLTMQLAILLCVFFTVVSFITTFAAVSINSSYEKNKREAAIMFSTNQLMESNYSKLEHSQNIIRRQVHDFKNHLRAINGMLKPGEQAKEYIEELLSETVEHSQYCNSGNKVIDSVINCKTAEAKQLNIPFEYSVGLSSELLISSVDICAVLSNQIDNAIEACSKIDESENRFVKVEIKQKEAFVFFKVTNSCSENPFDENDELKSAKDDATGIHGIGIKNISQIAENYSGTLKSDFKQGCFISVVMMCNNPKLNK